MFDSHKLAGAAAALAACMVAGSAHAHFTLLKPDPMHVIGFLGTPQKDPPCGPGDTDGPGTPSNKVTTVKAGDMLNVTWSIDVDHAGFFRISLDKDPSKFKEPVFTDPVLCSYDNAMVKTGSYENVLMDGIDAKATSQMVKIPDMPCDDCTLQVIQVMKNHGPPNCNYYHCAKLKILPKDGSTTAGSGGSAGMAGGGGAGMAGGGAGMAGGGGAGMAGGSAGMTGGSAGMTAGTAGTAGMTATAGTTGSAGMTGGAPGTPPAGNPTMMNPVTPATAGTGAMMTPTTGGDDDKGGCSVGHAGSARGAWTWLGLALAMLAVRRRTCMGAGASRRRTASR